MNPLVAQYLVLTGQMRPELPYAYQPVPPAKERPERDRAGRRPSRKRRRR